MSVVNKDKMLNQGAKQVNSNTNNKSVTNFNKNTGSSANSTPHRNPNFGGNKQDGNSANRSNKDKVARGSKQSGNKNLNSSNLNDWPKPGAPIFDIPIKEKSKDSQKFTGRCRVFVANLPTNISEEALKKLFEQFGEVSEVFLGKGNSFAFVKMDTRANAEAARAALDSKTYEGKTLRVRLAAHAAALRVKNLSSTVTNELLEYAFARFGEIERTVVITDYRGRSTGEGIVEFARKASAQNALKRCTNECFFITSMPKPVYVEPFEQKDDEEGFPEKHVNKHQPEFAAEREVGPRFGEPGTFEYEFGMRWKQLFDIEKQKQERLDEEIQEARKILQEQMEYSRVEHQTNMLREQLRQMEEQSTKYAQIQNNRMEDDRRRGEERQRQEMVIRQQTEDVLRMKGPQDMYHLKRQENELRSKANALQDLLERQEQSLNQFSTGMGPAPVPDSMYSNRLGPPVNDLGGHQPGGVMQGPAPIQPPMQQFQGNLGIYQSNDNSSTSSFEDLSADLNSTDDQDAWKEEDQSTFDHHDLSFEDNFKPFNRLPDSSNYIYKLEKRLDKLKCKDKEITSKEIIQYLESIKDDQFNNLFKSSIQFNIIEETLDEDNDSLYSSFERKFFPQRHAINPQELLQLIDNDYLNLIQHYHEEEEEKKRILKSLE